MMDDETARAFAMLVGMEAELENAKKEAELWEARARRAWHCVASDAEDLVRLAQQAQARKDDIWELEADLVGVKEDLEASRLLVKQLNHHIAQIRSDESSETADKE
jgi:phage shock protein A